MKSNILDIHGKSKGQIELPECFSSEIREDIVAKVLEAKKRKQPYAPSPVAGKQHSASGIIKHHRHVWKTHYGQGISRIPRKITSRKGDRFNWIGAEISSAVGGRRAHPPKILSMLNFRKINKKEMKIAMLSAISATADEKYLFKKYSRIQKSEKKEPFVVSSEITKLKIKELINSLKDILGKELSEVAIRKKSLRAGKGKLRGRKYKQNAGMLLVIGNDEKLRTNLFDVKKAQELNVRDLAEGGLGRLTLYTEKAIKNLGEEK